MRSVEPAEKGVGEGGCVCPANWFDLNASPKYSLDSHLRPAIIASELLWLNLFVDVPIISLDHSHLVDYVPPSSCSPEYGLAINQVAWEWMTRQKALGKIWAGAGACGVVVRCTDIPVACLACEQCIAIVNIYLFTLDSSMHHAMRLAVNPLWARICVNSSSWAPAFARPIEIAWKYAKNQRIHWVL